MLTGYRTLLARPGAPALVGAGLLARSPIATYPVALLALLGHEYGSFAVAGAAVGVYSIATVVAGPAAGRRYDRLGQHRALALAAGLQLATLLGIVGCVLLAAPVPAILAAAGGLGLVVPQAGVLVRARWATILTDREELRRALFLESALDEMTFVVGPLLVAALAAVTGPAGALAAAGAIAAAGALWLGRQRTTRAMARAQAADPTAVVAGWRDRRLATLCLTFAATGTVFGCVQVGVFAVTDQQGVAWAAGPVLAGFSGISLVAGLVGGVRQGGGAPVHRYRRTLAWLSVGMMLPATATLGPPALIAALAVAACSASTAVALGYSVAERHLPTTNLTEGLGYVAAGLNLGLAAGTALAGVIADIAGGRIVFVAGAAFGAIGFLAARRLRAAPRPAGKSLPVHRS